MDLPPTSRPNCPARSRMLDCPLRSLFHRPFFSLLILLGSRSDLMDKCNANFAKYISLHFKSKDTTSWLTYASYCLLVSPLHWLAGLPHVPQELESSGVMRQRMGSDNWHQSLESAARNSVTALCIYLFKNHTYIVNITRPWKTVLYNRRSLQWHIVLFYPKLSDFRISRIVLWMKESRVFYDWKIAAAIQRKHIMRFFEKNKSCD